jgi:hypothetical protein
VVVNDLDAVDVEEDVRCAHDDPGVELELTSAS